MKIMIKMKRRVMNSGGDLVIQKREKWKIRRVSESIVGGKAKVLYDEGTK